MSVDKTYLAASAVRFRSSSTSESVGMEGCAPTRVTDTAATAHPNRAASSGFMPCVSAYANPPLIAFSAQPFTAPTAKPVLRRSFKNKYTTIIGATAKTMAADIMP